ncbi:hypothetical protein ACLB1R_01665 [Escherichia coli]
MVDSHFDVVLGPIDYKKAMEFMPGRDFNYFISQQIKSYVGDALKFKIYVMVCSSNHDNQMNINNKLGFNISIGSGEKTIKNGVFVYYGEYIMAKVISVDYDSMRILITNILLGCMVVMYPYIHLKLRVMSHYLTSIAMK